MKKKILVIDDDVMALRMLKKYLEGEYEVQLENAGYRFVENLQDLNVDMILLDIEMPVMNGMEVLEAYRNLEHPDIPVVFLSGVANPQIVREAIEKGADGYIVKNAPKMEILTRISEIFKEHSGQKNVKNAIVLGADPKHIEAVKIIMESANYDVRVALSVTDSIKELKLNGADVLIITEPFIYADEKDIYDSICSYFIGLKIPVVFCENSFTRDSILDKVGKVLEG